MQLVYEYEMERKAVMAKLSVVDFKKPEGQMEAVELQGTLKGLNRALDILVEMANKREDASGE